MAKIWQIIGGRVDFDGQITKKIYEILSLGVNTKFVLGLPRARQVGLDRAKENT